MSDDDLTCDCGTPKSRGWAGLPELSLDDGTVWPLAFAAKYLDIPLDDLKAGVRASSLPPAGTGVYATYRRSGRQPRVYLASRLIELYETIYRLRQRWRDEDGDSPPA